MLFQVLRHSPIMDIELSAIRFAEGFVAFKNVILNALFYRYSEAIAEESHSLWHEILHVVQDYGTGKRQEPSSTPPLRFLGFAEKSPPFLSFRPSEFMSAWRNLMRCLCSLRSIGMTCLIMGGCYE